MNASITLTTNEAVNKPRIDKLNGEDHMVRRIEASSNVVRKRYALSRIEGLRVLPCSRDDMGRSIKPTTKERAEAARPAGLTGTSD
jgi:hypothetical protein